MRTHVYRWSFDSICAADKASLEDCGRHHNSPSASAVCSSQREASSATAEETERQQLSTRAEALPHADTDNIHTKLYVELCTWHARPRVSPYDVVSWRWSSHCHQHQLAFTT